jgi:hypothetical protein
MSTSQLNIAFVLVYLNCGMADNVEKKGRGQWSHLELWNVYCEVFQRCRVEILKQCVQDVFREPRDVYVGLFYNIEVTVYQCQAVRLKTKHKLLPPSVLTIFCILTNNCTFYFGILFNSPYICFGRDLAIIRGTFFFCGEGPPQLMLRTHHSLKAYCATL